MVRRDTEHLGHHGHDLLEPSARLHGVDRLGRRVFLHVCPVLVEVHGDGVLGQVRVVGAEAMDVFAGGPAARCLRFLRSRFPNISAPGLNPAIGSVS